MNLAILNTQQQEQKAIEEMKKYTDLFREEKSLVHFCAETAFIFRQADVIDRSGNNAGFGQHMRNVNQILQQGRRIGTVFVLLLKIGNDLVYFADRQIFEQFENLISVSQTNHVFDNVSANFATAKRNRLIQQRFAVTRRTVSRFGNDMQRLFVKSNVFVTENFLKHPRAATPAPPTPTTWWSAPTTMQSISAPSSG